MASFGQTFDASSVEPSSGYEVLPPGKYLAQIVASEMRATKDGMGQYLYLEVDVIEGLRTLHHRRDFKAGGDPHENPHGSRRWCPRRKVVACRLVLVSERGEVV